MTHRTKAGEQIAAMWEKVLAGKPVTLGVTLPHNAPQADYDSYNKLYRWLHNHHWVQRKVGLGEGPFTSSTYYPPGKAPYESPSSSLARLRLNWPSTHV